MHLIGSCAITAWRNSQRSSLKTLAVCFNESSESGRRSGHDEDRDLLTQKPFGARYPSHACGMHNPKSEILSGVSKWSRKKHHVLVALQEGVLLA